MSESDRNYGEPVLDSENSDSLPEHVEPGAVWRSRRRGEQHRKLCITAVSIDGDRVYVYRNTSRRKQSVSVKTLTRDYRYDGDTGD